MNHIEAVIEEVFALLAGSEGEQYFGERVSKLEHALQCAHLASLAGGDDELVLAALLHDIGHLFDTQATIRDERVGVVNHDELGGQWLLERGFSPRLARLVASHVDAKRYLTATNAGYLNRLSPASTETLALQGGPMTAFEVEKFAANPDLRDILRLRSWDEMAKDPAWRGPSLEEYLPLLRTHLESASGVISPRLS